MQFLYPSDVDTHRLLRFLLDKLSQTTSASRGRVSRKGRAGRTTVDEFGSSKISATVHNALSLWLEESNSTGLVVGEKEIRAGQSAESPRGSDRVDRPFDGDEKPAVHGVPFRTCPLRLASFGDVYKKPPALLTLQVKPRSWLAPSVLELNAVSVLRAAKLADAQLAHLARHSENATLSNRKVISQGVLILESVKTSEDGKVGSAFSVSSAGSSFARAVMFGEEHEWVPRLHGVHRGNDLQEGVDNGVVPLHEGQVVPAPEKRAKEISNLEEQLSVLARRVEKMALENTAVEEEKVELRKKFADAVEETNMLDKTQLLMKEAVKMALQSSQSPEDVVNELELNVKDAEQRMMALQAEWDAVRNRLEEKVGIFERNVETRNSEVQLKLKKIKETRQEIKEMAAKVWESEAEETQLTAELERVGKGATRATYVRRITELIRNSKKQDADIALIINETRDLQRDSNSAQDRLRRVYALVDELVFRDAKKDPVCRQAYKLLSCAHENFADIVDKVLDMDKIGREISELQSKLEDLEKRPLDATSLQSDLDAVISENCTLEKRLPEGFLISQKSTE